MAIYTNSANVADKGYMVARSSKIKATDSGHLYDLVDMTNDVEQGCNIKAGEFLGTGYQEREALTPAVGDAIIFVCDVPLVYDAYTQGQNAETNYINVKGKAFKGYEIVKDDVFGVSANGFTTVVGEIPAKGNYVVVDGNRKWKEVADAPSAETYGFIGQIIGYEVSEGVKVVLINTIKNEAIA